MEINKLKYLHFVGSIEKWMESGEPVLTLKYLLNSAGNDLTFVQECLDTWQREGRIEWLKPLDSSKPDEQVIRFKKWIRKNVPWPR